MALTTRRSAIKARTALIRQIKSILVTAPDALRSKYEGASTESTISRLLLIRPNAALRSVTASTTVALRRLARRHQYLTVEIDETTVELQALVRLNNDQRTKNYAARRRAEGKTTKDILRCLKRAIAREVWHLLVHPAPMPQINGLRPLRNSLGIRLEEAPAALGTRAARISDPERGKHRNNQLIINYQA